MIYNNRNKITGYQKKFNELLEQKNLILGYCETSGDFIVYDKNENVIGIFYDELNKNHDATDWKIAYNNLKKLLKDM